MNINERQHRILAAVIEEYTKTGLPVGSSVLRDGYKFKVSPATLRSDMAHLEEVGYLHQPHTSAGRMPSDAGYRYFVENIMAERELSKEQQVTLQKELLQLRAQNTRLMRTTAKLISTVSGYAAVIVNAKTGETSEFGLKNLLAHADQENIDDLCKIAETLDYIDEQCDTLMEGLSDSETQIYIGEENPISKTKNYSMVVGKYQSGDDEGVVALIGPKNMKYDKSKSLIDYVRKMIGTGTGAGAFIVYLF